MAGLDNLLLVSALPGYLRAARLAQGSSGDCLEDLVISRADRPGLQGAVYLGRVLQVDRGLEAAFVDLGLPEPGFLPFGRTERRPVQGEALVVEVRREAFDGKGARLSARIAQPIQAKVADLATASEAPTRLLAPPDPLAALVARHPPAEVVVDGPEALAALPGLPAGLAVERDSGAVPLFERYGVDEEIEALIGPEVALPGGGGLLIEPTRTLVAVDVNAGAGRAGSASRLALETDLEAAEALPRQLRLRNLAGLTVVDFLELKQREERQEVVRRLRRGLKRDPQAGQVRAMSETGLVELTRRRAGPALHDLLTRPCGLHGSGRAWDPAVLAWNLLLRVASAGRGRSAVPRVLCSPAVAQAFAGPAAAARQAVEARLGQNLAVVPEADREDDACEVAF